MGGSPVGVGAEVGRVAGLWRYPVKSMAPERVPGADVSWHGVSGDRRWAFIRERGQASGFPWLTIRDRPDMVHYRPRFVDAERPDRSPVVVTTPTGAELAVTDPALAAELGGGDGDGVRAVKLDRGTFDTLPLSLITTGTVAGLEALTGRALDVRRFRPNLVIDAHDDGGPFPEEGWVGCTLQLGDAVVRVDGRDQRCIVVNVDPATAQADPIVLGTIARSRQTRLGVYATTVRPGRVAVGDPVVVAGAQASGART
ncbi:MAG TPA: MOSC N-terminal beta barrel domain-containing protein [Acidimicrobiales bacterium]|jgi:hypothetical protein